MLSLYHPEAIRLFLLTKHYRSPLDYTEKGLRDAEKALYGLYESLYFLKKVASEPPPLEKGATGDTLKRVSFNQKKLSKAGKRLAQALEKFRERFLQALAEDLNTAEALAETFTLISEVNRFLPAARKASSEEAELATHVLQSLRELPGNLLGIGTEDPEAFIENERERKLKLKGLDRKEIERRLSERETARKNKDFETADRIREELTAQGLILRDTPWGTFWMVER